MELAVFDNDPTLYLFTSLTAGSSHIVTATSRIETILKANKIPFTYKDTATDDLARKLFQRRAMGKKLPMLVQGGYVIADLEEIEEWNEYGELHDNIKVVAAAPMTPKPVPGAASAPKTTAQAPAKQENKDPATALAMRVLSAEAAAKGAAKKPIPVNIATTNPLLTEKVNTPTTPSKAAAARGILSPKSVPLPATPTVEATKKEGVKAAEKKATASTTKKNDIAKSAEKKDTAKSTERKATASTTKKTDTSKSAEKKGTAKPTEKKAAASTTKKNDTPKSAQKKDTAKFTGKKGEKAGDTMKAIPRLAKPGDNKYKSDAPPRDIATGGVSEAPVAVHHSNTEASPEDIKANENSQATKEDDDEDEDEESEEEESDEEESSEDETDEEAGDPGPDVMSTLSPLYRGPKPEHEEKVVASVKKEESSEEDESDESDESEEDESEEEAPTASKIPAAKKPELSAKAGEKPVVKAKEESSEEEEDEDEEESDSSDSSEEESDEEDEAPTASKAPAGEKSAVSTKANEKSAQGKESKTQDQSAKAGDKAGVSVED